jgi:malonyl-CoA O-methyltransferase
LSELQRVIRPGGLLVFATLSAGSLDELRRAWRQVDELDHVNSFITEVALRDLCAESGFKEVRWECRRHVLYYESLNELLMGLKGIGANQVSGNKSTGLAGRQRWLQFQAAYEAERDYSGRLPVSYEVCYGVLMR